MTGWKNLMVVSEVFERFLKGFLAPISRFRYMTIFELHYWWLFGIGVDIFFGDSLYLREQILAMVCLENRGLTWLEVNWMSHEFQRENMYHSPFSWIGSQSDSYQKHHERSQNFAMVLNWITNHFTVWSWCNKHHMPWKVHHIEHSL